MFLSFNNYKIMRNFKTFIITVIAGCMAGFGFSSCGGDDDKGSIDANSYKVEVAFGSGAENYFKHCKSRPIVTIF
jgi:hypothetical protein